MPNRKDLPPELQENLRRLQRLHLALRRPTHQLSRMWCIAAHANGVLGMWLVLRVLQAYFRQSFDAWALFETLAATVELGFASFALRYRGE
ncbi:MAG: hypothetical protein ABI612_06645 [Betaproteobacteria bacterium]